MGFSMFSLSKEQERAVDITKNIAVSAGAGSGKTRVLTNRYLRLLDAGYEIDEIAAITFTEKAALEMKQRIRRAIIEKISTGGKKEKRKWMEHLDRLGRANISTIHGFCSNMIRENAACLGIDFNSDIINDVDKSIILREAADEARAKCFSKEKYQDILVKLSRVYGEKYLNSVFLNDIQKIREQVQGQGNDLEELMKNSGEGSLEKLVYEVAFEIDRIYQQYKMGRGLLDYNDLEIMTLKVLENKRIRERYRKRYKTLLVDEFQDTNEIQRRIIYYLAADDEGNLIPAKLFIVGDFKQSIYGFRGTDYTIFKKVSSDIGEDGHAPLSTCYRSKNEIIEGINSIFSKLIEDYEPLKCPEHMPNKEKRIKIITTSKSNEKDKSVTGEIKNLLKGKTSLYYKNLDEAFEALKESYDKLSSKENRDGAVVMKAIKLLRDKGLDFKDICILVRSKSTIPEIEKELKRRNVPYCIIGGRGFYQKGEVDEILNLYRVIIRGFNDEFSYEDNINFIKALRGPLFEIPDSLILKMSIERDESKCKNLYEAMNLVIDGMKVGVDRERLLWVYNTLGKLAILKERLSVVQILRAIVEECRVFEIMLSMEGGFQKFRNIEKLIHEAQRFDDQELFTLEQFVEYIQELNENSGADSEAPLDTEDSEAVKIMTIHQSKGLEFKGVIVPRIHGDLLSVSKMQKSKIVYTGDKILSSINLDTGDKSEEYKIYYDSRFSKEVDEYIRLLYVAMTRAQEYVILTGEDDGKDPKEFNSNEEKVNELNSFLKQIKYALRVKGADDSLIDFIDAEDLNDLDEVEGKTKSKEIDQVKIEERIKYKFKAEPGAVVSATGYMNYKKCPRRFYIENVLKVNGREYIDMEISEELEFDAGKISSSIIGTAVHSLIEVLNGSRNIDEEEAVRGIIRKYGLEKFNGIEERLKNYLEGYRALEGKKKDVERPVLRFNELEYNLVPYGDRRFSVTGFIDRLEVFERDGRLKAVITDYKTNRIDCSDRLKELVETYELQLQIYGKAVKELLYINGIKVEDLTLQLYFLNIPERVEIIYDEDKVMEQLKDMYEKFSRSLSGYSPSDFPKKVSGECDKCRYRKICQ
ncbi:UvrD-helicase domain-containing protein [Fonticella tunisiensis]|uniref:DNA 3'-5' helicase n=1 Tax=Fonticella tunisiensis TaxID=1096341 RepID=A0A4R7K5G3_9CLOT|nr:UvrD-helicase domain-containing protein [Fonticella tunisiensis]TDT46101.1 ATP-dependent helicase/nuclease subunit A [Fonticella tunisiensis]